MKSQKPATGDQLWLATRPKIIMARSLAGIMGTGIPRNHHCAGVGTQKVCVRSRERARSHGPDSFYIA